MSAKRRQKRIEKMKRKGQLTPRHEEIARNVNISQTRLEELRRMAKGQG